MSNFFQEATPEANALMLRHKYKIPVGKVDLEGLVEKLGILIMEEDLGTSGKVCGCLVRDGYDAVILINKHINNLGRKRFTISHELGHYCLPSHVKTLYECDKFKIEDFGSKDDEDEANAFASELLLPSRIVKEVLHRKPVSLELIQAVADEYEMSISAVAVKFTKLSQEDTCACVLSQNNTMIWRFRSPRFFRRELDIKREVYSSQKDKEKSHPAHWLIGKEIDDIPYVLEESLVFPNLQMKLSIITIPDDGEDDALKE